MCTVSMVGDYWKDIYPEKYPWIKEYPGSGLVPTITYPDGPTKEEFAALKKEVEELKILLLAAKRFDTATNQHDCHMDEKVALIKKIAEIVGVSMEDVFKD